ncbi:MAG: FAD-dependent monooxygenase [Gammaproteobacteria bacterium]|nr:FAD-dependent monooxygenase [Gammaproteobacteria bacterium]MCW5583258.1 FAD-dependent monooxygenase [Gammaproteobacteria bacterium]
MNKHLPVLIVGAGPTGLMVACELARYGVSFRIVDKKAEPTLSSNATWIQSRTIEIFEHIGMANRFIKLSNRCHAINLYFDGKSLVKIPLKYIDSKYPYILILPQSETEQLLNQRLEELDHKVERSVELINVEQRDDGVVSEVRYADGHMEKISSNWLIACDGANSTVREKCGIFFPGEDLSEQFIVADADIESFMSKNEAHVFLGQATLFAAFPLASGKYRITANLHLDYPRRNFSEREVIEMVQERAQGAYYVKAASWISSFWIHSRVVNHMRQDRIFLVGDAAHVHSPAGGQGMNSGIQDAYNLAWKLALVIQEKAVPSLLDSYHMERYPIIQNIVKQTEYYTKMALSDDLFLENLHRFTEKIKNNETRVSKKIGEQLTQLNIRYKNSPIIDYENVSGTSLLQGIRAPNIVIDSSTQLYDFFQNTKHNILFFTGLTLRKGKLTKLIELQKSLNEMYGDLINIYIVTRDIHLDMDNVILDLNGMVHQCYKIKHSAVYIIRPDNYIAYCAKNFDLEYIDRFLKRYLC